MSNFRLGLLLFFFTFLLPYNDSGAELQQVVRVAVLTQAPEINLSISGSYQILALNTNAELYQGARLWRAKVIPTEKGIKINQIDFQSSGLRIQPKHSPAIYLNGRKFRGTVDVIRQPNKSLLAINYLEIEEYLQGVLYHEVSPHWPMEALKAQAIVARTFALYQTQINAGKEYDLVSTAYSQVYGGSTSEKGRTSEAIQLTKNQVLTYKNKIFPAFYHATCAGHTEDAARLWKIDLPTLKGRDCQFCQRSPHLHWRNKVLLKDIEEALGKIGLGVNSIRAIKIVDRDISGRVTDLEIDSSSGKVRISANRFRLSLGPNLIRSTNFSVELKKRAAYFEGDGWGHGVGLCQWGAFFMAKNNFNARQILNYYYPESKIKELKDVQASIKAF